MKTSIKIVSIFLAILVVVSTVLFASFEAHEINHECEGKDCPICYQINAIKDVVKGRVILSACAFFVVALLLKTVISLFDFDYQKKHSTLISLKVELLN